MINVICKDKNKQINIYNIIKIFQGEEEITFSKKIKGRGLDIDIGVIDEIGSVKIYKDGNLVKENYINNTEYNYSKGKLIVNTLYEALSEYFKYEADYGTLTGIRPVKLVRTYIKKGYNLNQLKKILNKRYYLSNKKTEELFYIAQKESQLINSDKISIYVNIPFCPSKCKYCNFVSFINREDEIEKYIEYLKKDLMENFRLINRYNLEVESIYIGGGTPSILNNSLMEELLSYIKANILDFKEFTFEAGRTDTLTEEKLEIMARYGVNRISINPQSFNQDTLFNLNRYQDLSELERYFKLCKNKNISINSDLILGLPGENFLDIKSSLDKLIELNPDNITLHTLSIKNNSGISKEKLMSEEELLDSYNYAKSKLKSKNYQPYYLYRQKDIVENLDNIGYSKLNKESLYNMNMIEESQTVISAGLGSVTKIVGNTGIKRIPYNKSFKDYYHKYIYVNQNKEEYLKKILEEE
ncbi:coproporphyrinogen dehydrogenase HemZ [Halanaerobium sp.]|uniref:coproporphyrinogen dehydrogenase HemZ n=1 Tax=Halanaerobium sp. TaxID=1895664 RepID=UPI000DE72817|nr:coproporphyrinogen dehydrogenase HemZ [Halanaerobium sp.]PUU95001.1 MAG: oxygen-independent coproporphyrinogen III oxidase [Halanaerobium sp.]